MKRQAEHEAATSTVVTASSNSSSADNTDNESPGCAVGGSPCIPKRAHRASFNTLTPSLAAALDRTGTSSCQATFVLDEAAQDSLGHDVADVNINRMSIHRQCNTEYCLQKELKDTFSVDVPVVVHWD